MTMKKDFKGFADWVEIFRGGTQTDSSGTEHDGDEMIDVAVSSFNANEHQPPLVVGHPKENEPAYGWVSDLKEATVNGVRTLIAKFEEVVPEFEELVAAGRYKKRSASFYPDGRLRHVGFLGAVPPAVKGLADLQFQDDTPEMISFDFDARGRSGDAGAKNGTGAFHEDSYKTGVLTRIMGRLREYFIEKDGIDAADRVLPPWDIDTLKEETVRETSVEPALYKEQNPKEEITMGANTEVKSFSEADIEAAKEKARQEGQAAAAAEFAEVESTRKKEAAKAAVKVFCDEGVEKGKLIPAWIDGGLQEFMEGLDGEEEISFSEDKKQTRLEWFMDFMEQLPQSVNFKEIVSRDELPNNDDADDIAKRAKEFQAAEANVGRDVSITDAVAHVTK